MSTPAVRGYTLDVEQRFQLILRGTEEVITEDELKQLLDTTVSPRAYWGFEPSGGMHIGTGLICGGKIKDMVDAGCQFTIFLADWHAWINNKLGGNLENIRLCAEYFRQCFTGLGIPPNKVTYLLGSELEGGMDYWEKVIRIAKSNSTKRIRRALPIMGRETETEDVETAALFYPCMQAADIFQLDLDIACAGIDQRKAHVIARESAQKLQRKKPVSIHTPLLLSLFGGSQYHSSTVTPGNLDENPRFDFEIGSKMAKSIPGSAILVHDQPEQIKDKVRSAYCPPRETQDNPVLEIVRLISIPQMGSLEIQRPAKYGGHISFAKYEEVRNAYALGQLHPQDLKDAVAKSLSNRLEGVRGQLAKNPELLSRITAMEITR
jgi:tyrosyl-tRNA synthetase